MEFPERVYAQTPNYGKIGFYYDKDTMTDNICEYVMVYEESSGVFEDNGIWVELTIVKRPQYENCGYAYRIYDAEGHIRDEMGGECKYDPDTHEMTEIIIDDSAIDEILGRNELTLDVRKSFNDMLKSQRNRNKGIAKDIDAKQFQDVCTEYLMERIRSLKGVTSVTRDDWMIFIDVEQREGIANTIAYISPLPSVNDGDDVIFPDTYMAIQKPFRNNLREDSWAYECDLCYSDYKSDIDYFVDAIRSEWDDVIDGRIQQRGYTDEELEVYL